MLFQQPRRQRINLNQRNTVVFVNKLATEEQPDNQGYNHIYDVFIHNLGQLLGQLNLYIASHSDVFLKVKAF